MPFTFYLPRQTTFFKFPIRKYYGTGDFSFDKSAVVFLGEYFTAASTRKRKINFITFIIEKWM
jgi:hypothetical protein